MIVLLLVSWRLRLGGGGAKTGWYRISNPNTAASTQKCESVSCSHFKDGIIIDDTMGFETEPRTYEGICPSLRASRQGLKTVGIVDPQGRTQKKCNIQETCPTLRAQTHGNPPCAVYHKTENEILNGTNWSIYQTSYKARFYQVCCGGGAVDLSYPNSKTRRGRVQDGGLICPTITAQNTGICIIEARKNSLESTWL